MNTNIRSIAARVVMIAGLAGSATAIIPGVAGAAGCTGKTIDAKASHTTIYGTGCDDVIRFHGFVGVTVYAGGGNDTVHAGYVGSNGTNYVYGQDGNDRVVQLNDKRVWFAGGAGNDSLEGSSGYDAFLGGSGTDTFIDAMPGDYDESVEVFA